VTTNSAPLWPRAFPGGIADAAGRHALWRDAAGRLVALRLADGQRLWRGREAMWPLLLDEHRALALSFGPPRIVALALASPDGTELWRSEPLPWPRWAVELPGPTAGTGLHAAWTGDAQALLTWRLQALHGGGAPLPRDRRPAPATGACTVDAASGRLQMLAQWPQPPAMRGETLASDDPSVQARATLDGIDYRIVQQRTGERTKTLLSAHDIARSRTLWNCELDEIEPRPPRALRP
jgi:YD repeat-containing protein